MSTDPLVDFSLSPSCSCNASRNVGPVSSGWEPSGWAESGTSDHSRLKSNVPVRPVRSNTGRSTPVKGFVKKPAIRPMVTLVPTSRPRPGALAGIGPMLPQGIGGNCKPDADESVEAEAGGTVPGGCGVEAVEHDSFPECA